MMSELLSGSPGSSTLLVSKRSSHLSEDPSLGPPLRRMNVIKAIESDSASSKLESISESLNSSLESSEPSEEEENDISMEQLNIKLQRGEDKIFGAPEDILLDEHSPLPEDENSVSEHSEALDSLNEDKKQSEIEEDLDKLGEMLDLPELIDIKKKAGMSSKNLVK